jgi:hypothetical protein
MVVPLRRGRGRGGAGRRWMARRRSFPRINARRPRVFFRLRFSASCNPDRRAGNFRASNRGTASERGKRSEGKRKMRKRRGGGEHFWQLGAFSLRYGRQSFIVVVELGVYARPEMPFFSISPWRETFIRVWFLVFSSFIS